MKKFIYLVQGQSDLIRQYLHLADRDNADAVFLTYDKPISEALFRPDSTWAQGRNHLLEIALTRREYVYYIFCDDDLAFRQGGWDEFEEQLTAHAPAIAVPLFLRKTRRTRLKWLRYQAFLINDEQLMAFHHEVVSDGIVLPYQDQFDDMHWWASCEIQEILIQNFYRSGSIQFNDIRVSNECKLRYPNPDAGRNAFKKHIRDWLSEQFVGGYKDISKEVGAYLPVVLWRTFGFAFRRSNEGGGPGYSVSERDVRHKLSPDSELLKQYLTHIAD